MKISLARGAAAVLAAALLFGNTVARADADQVRAECQAEATAAGIQDPAELNNFINDCMQAKAGNDAGSGDQTDGGEQAPAN